MKEQLTEDSACHRLLARLICSGRIAACLSQLLAVRQLQAKNRSKHLTMEHEA